MLYVGFADRSSRDAGVSQDCGDILCTRNNRHRTLLAARLFWGYSKLVESPTCTSDALVSGGCCLTAAPLGPSPTLKRAS